MEQNRNQSLAHYGVLGMKWGIRKDRLTAETKSGDTITLCEQPPSKLAAFLARHSKKAATEQEKTAIFTINDPNGKSVGDITLYKESPDSINVVWVTTNESVRGRGYGTAVMKSAIQIAKDTGCKQVTLEVPGNSPDARHIYEKLGFKEVSSPDIETDDIWGGLTNMRLDLDKAEHSWLAHGGLIKISTQLAKSYIQYLVDEIDNFMDTKMAYGKGGGKLMDNSNKFLSHYGVLGMKWGVRKASPTIDSASNSFRRSAKRLRENADVAGAYAYLRTNAKGEVSSKASLYTKLNVSNAQARAKRLREKATELDNIATGIKKSKKLIAGMDMKQSVATMEKAAGYSKGQIVYNKLLMDRSTRLSFASIDYALKVTNSGKKDV